METVKIEIEVCKETKEVFEALAGIVKGIKEKKPVAEIIAAELNDVIKAIEGFQALPEEAKSEQFHDTVAHGVASITKILMSK